MNQSTRINNLKSAQEFVREKCELEGEEMRLITLSKVLDALQHLPVRRRIIEEDAK